jgi:twinkle protein
MATLSDFLELDIQPKALSAKQQKVKCPKCKESGKTNLNDNCLSINMSEGLYNCHKCGWSGKVRSEQTIAQMIEQTKAYKLPEQNSLSDIKNNAIQFLKDRGITQEVIDNNKVKSSRDGRGVVFAYYKNGKIINYKTRAIDSKKFFQAKEAEPIMYNYDRIKNQKIVFVCEGEMDSLSWEVAGIKYHTSVSQGAPNVGDKNIDKKLECLNTCSEVFENKKKIYIAVDNDENGRFLEKELVRRFGAERCLLVDYSPYKDANEVLVKEGIEGLQKRAKNASQPKVDGIFTVNDITDSMLDGYRNGQERGSSTYIEEVDKAWTWRAGEVNIWTGYQNEGKSLFLNQLATIKASVDGWKFAIFSPENMPMNDFFNDIIEMYIGKSCDPYYKNNYMTEAEYRQGMSFVQNHFNVIYPQRNFSLHTIFEKAKFLIKTQGIRALIIDPYNTVQHKMNRGEREDLYISRFMSELKRFAVDNNISIHLVAHQVTPQKNDDGRYPKPDVNRIKGGGTFADKADNVLFVWRPDRAIDFSSKKVVFGSQKIKKQKLVGYPQDIGNISFDIRSSRYSFNGRTPFSQIDKLRING